MVKEHIVRFESEGDALEGVILSPKDHNGAGIVVCHPHPLYGGNMENMVVWGICDALARKGVVSLRFNFKGVGGSEGIHTGGEGEVMDTLAAVEFLLSNDAIDTVKMAGYSFGAMMALKAALLDKRIKKVACVAIPVDFYDEITMKERKDLGVLIIGGKEDLIVQVDSLVGFANKNKGNVRLELIEGVDHKFEGKNKLVGEMVADFLTG